MRLLHELDVLDACRHDSIVVWRPCYGEDLLLVALVRREKGLLVPVVNCNAVVGVLPDTRKVFSRPARSTRLGWRACEILASTADFMSLVSQTITRGFRPISPVAKVVLFG